MKANYKMIQKLCFKIEDKNSLEERVGRGCGKIGERVEKEWKESEKQWRNSGERVKRQRRESGWRVERVEKEWDHYGKSRTS